MNDPEPDPHDDPWMTIAEFAEEMRVRPVTVRSWIAKGQLKATRAGQRKWLVRRSELTRMLEQGDGVTALHPPPAPRRAEILEPDDRPAEMWDRMVEEAVEEERERQEQDYAVADYEWEIALEQSRMAPPDARFASRIRHIALAASRRAAVIRECMDDPGFVWTPIPDSIGMTLSYELRSGGARPGPKDAWDRVDRVVTRLGIALEGDSGSAVASALRDLSSAMTGVADAIENRPARAPLTDGPAEPPEPKA
ncbi:MAG: helix-turn-helix domain-containing protein [Solirubrobacteraceae bacterium]